MRRITSLLVALKYCRIFEVDEPQRSQAYRAGFEYLTGHETFEDAVEDLRWMSSKGVSFVHGIGKYFPPPGYGSNEVALGTEDK